MAKVTAVTEIPASRARNSREAEYQIRPGIQRAIRLMYHIRMLSFAGAGWPSPRRMACQPSAWIR